MDYKEPIDSHRIDGHTYCIADEMIDQGIKTVGREDYKPCGSSDAMASYISEYEDGTETYSSYCFSCAQSFQQKHLAKSSLAGEFGLDPEGVITEKKTFERKPKQPRITNDQIKEVMSHGYSCELKHGVNRGKPIRGIKEKYNKFFGHITKKDKNGNPTVRFYPETSDGKMMGYKTRTFPKGFGYENVGITGIKNDLSGQVKFKDMHFRDIMICGGEEDKVAFFQQFDEYQERRYGGSDQEYAPMPVVSPTTGEGSAIKQLRDQYDFINRAERIFLGLDNDEAGRKAMDEIAKIFPKEKVFIIHWSYKDPNNAINNKEGKDYSAQTIRDFYNAKPYDSTNTVKSSKDVMGSVAEVLLKERITLPSYMSKISKMMGGDSGEEGMLQNTIVNIIGNTSCGKTTHTNGMTYHWFMTSPQKPIVASLEATAGQYALDIISIHLGENVRHGRTGKEVLDYLNTPEIKTRLEDLWENEYGEERFKIIDERDGDIKSLEKQLEEAFHRDGCELFIIDVLTDILRNLSIEQQSEHMSWQKNMVKKGATIVNVLHTTKPKRDKDGKMIPITEYCAYGSSTFVQSAAINILIDRDKMIDDPIEKNTTRVRMPKCREGHTGDAGEWYYDVETRKVYDRDRYFESNPDKLPAGYDLKSNPYSQESTKQFSKKAGSNNSEPEKDIMDGVPL